MSHSGATRPHARSLEFRPVPRAVAVFAWSLLLIVGAQSAAWAQEQIATGWWPAYDTNAYWLAARHVASGEPLYQQSTIIGAGIYKYPPVFAQLIAPIGWLPELLVDWAWRLFGLACLRYLCGSWRLTLIAALQWPVFAELSFGNVTLQLGAALLFALRDRRGAYVLPWLAALKVGPGLLIVYLYATRPEYRRPLVQGCAIFAAACAASFAIAPGLWVDYAGTFGWEAASEMNARFVYAFTPQSGGLDFAIRLAMGLAVLLAAIRWRRDWLAFTVAALTMPIFSLTRLAVLVGLWPLWLREPVDRWRRGEGRAGLPRPSSSSVWAWCRPARRGRRAGPQVGRPAAPARPDRPAVRATSGQAPTRPTSSPSSAGTIFTRAAGTRRPVVATASRAGPSQRSPCRSATVPPIDDAIRVEGVDPADAGDGEGLPGARHEAGTAPRRRPAPPRRRPCRSAAPRAARAARNGDRPAATSSRPWAASPAPAETPSRWPRPPQPHQGPPSMTSVTWPSSPAVPSGPSIRPPSWKIAPPSPVETVTYRKLEQPRRRRASARPGRRRSCRARGRPAGRPAAPLRPPAARRGRRARWAGRRRGRATD